MAEKSGGYSVGNLEVSLTALGTSAADSLDLVIKRLNTIDNLVKSVGKKINSLSVGKGTLSSFDSLNRKLKSIKELSEKSGKNFTSKFKINKTTLTQLEKINKLQQGITSSKSGKGAGFGGIYAGLRILTTTTKRLFGFTSNLVEKASDYLETLNLWQVAFKNNTDVADKFIQKMNRLYGVSEKNLMNYQAIFKNMFSSLGGLEEATSSKLSEAFTKWALDFSSLFNVSIDSAMSKFQAVLSGQVRPVRSVSGFDITERTLYNIYQGMGGTKTMRQLDILEKRLLSVYAIYQQMEKANALGDLGKTINQFANQSRITKEIIAEIAQWAGTILKLFLDNNDVLIKLNAGLIVARDVMEGIARYMGFSEPDFLKDMLQTTEAENSAVDELQGKLLSFDRFESLNSADTTGNLAIDQTILDAIADYESKMENVDNLAQKLAEQWEAALGFQRDSEGNLIQSDETIGGILEKVKGIGKGFLNIIGIIGLFLSPLKTIMVIFGALYAGNEIFRKSVNNLIASFAPIINLIIDILKSGLPLINSFLNIAISLLGIALPILQSFVPIITFALETVDFFMPIIQFLTSMVELIVRLLDSMGILKPLIFGIGTAFATWKILDLMNGLNLFNGALSKTQLALGAVAAGLGFLIGDGFLSLLGDDAKRIVAPIMLAVGAISALAIAVMAYKGVLTWGVGIPILLAAIGAGVAGLKTMLEPDLYAQGGYPDRGTLFIAGEAGAEVVMSDGSGRTSVTNIVEMEEAVYRGARRALSEVHFGGRNGDVYLDGKKVGIVTEGATYTEGTRVGRLK